MNRNFITILFLSGVFFSHAQNLSQTVRGTVTDKESKVPLIGATIMVLNGTTLGGVSDENGKFRITNVPVGRKTIKVSYLGYNDVFVNDVIVNSAKEVVLNIEMQEKVLTHKEIVITGKTNKSQTNNELILISGRSFTIDQTNRFAGSLSDPSRMAANFAGVAGGGNDQRNDIIIRGNSPLGLLWRLEGADIPNPNHFSNQGANGGPVSILNNNTLSNSDFLTGAFPAEYGNGNSGVFDLKMRNGNNEKHEFLGQLGFNGLELLAEGPIKKGESSYLISYRYSTLALFNAVGIQFGESGIPFYQDLSFKFNFPKTKIGSFSVWGIGGISSTQLISSNKPAAERAKLQYPQDIDFSSRMGAAGITHSFQLTKKSYIKTVLSVSGEGNRTRVDSLDPNDNKFYVYNSNSLYGKIALHSFYAHKFNARNSVKFGVIGSRIYGSQYDSVYINALHGFRQLINFSDATFLGQVYFNWNYRITNELTFNAGIHYNELFLNHSNSIEPRASIRWQTSGGHIFSAGFGLHGQIQQMYTYFQKTLVDTLHNGYINTNQNLGMSKSEHFILGYEKMISNEVRFKTEVYYQYLFNLPVTQYPGVYSNINTGADFATIHVDSLVNNGIGRNYGIEFTLERFFSNGYYYLITTSLYQSEYKASDGVWRNTAFNGNYVVNVLAGKEWKIKKSGTLIASLKVTSAGGRRIIPVDEAQSKAVGFAVYDYSHAYQNRLPDYFRTDIRISYKINGKKVTQEWALDIQNVFNTQNILTQQFNPQTGTVQNLYQIGIFPVPLYRIYF
ncbi:MAG: carboxypeptidase-like regulatory domain-containing protein [Bacteroidia bacterium]